MAAVRSIVLLTVFDFLSEIVDGNLKMTLGMIWTIILRFAIQDINVEGNQSIMSSSAIDITNLPVECC